MAEETALQDFTNLQKLAVAQALYKALGALVSTDSGSGSIRAEEDEALREEFEGGGTDRRRIFIDGIEVGKLSARVSREIDRVEPVIDDDAEFVQWLRESDGGLDTLRRLVADGRMRSKVLAAATADGELPDGCAMVRRREPAHWLGTTLTVDKQAVGRALGGDVTDAFAVLGLPGGDE